MSPARRPSFCRGQRPDQPGDGRRRMAERRGTRRGRHHLAVVLEHHADQPQVEAAERHGRPDQERPAEVLSATTSGMVNL